jgi:hypothetical protein
VRLLASTPASNRRRLVWMLAACFGLLGILEVLLLTRNGPGVSPDSANYLSAADSVTSTGTFRGFLPRDQIAVFAPLYPLLLVPGEALGAPVTDARIIGALAFGLLIGTAVIGAARVNASSAYPAGVGAALLVAVPLLRVDSFVWSDGPFALTVALFLLSTSDIGSRRHAAALSGVLASTAGLIRYIGVTTIPIGLMAIIFRSTARRREVRVFLGLSVLGPALWIARNLLVTSTLAGHRHSAADGVGTAIHDTALTIGIWIHPSHPAFALVLAGALFLPALWTLRRRPPGRLETVSFVFCVLYLAWIVWSAASVALDPIDDRFLAPVYVPLVWLAVSSLERLASIATPTVGRMATLATLIALLGAWAYVQASRLPAVSDDVRLSSVAMLPSWNAADEARARRISSDIYSNAPDVMYLRRRVRVLYAPRRAAYRSDDPFDELTPLRAWLAENGPAALIWFRAVKRPAVYTPSELANAFEVRLVGRTYSATIYRLSCPCKASAARDR